MSSSRPCMTPTKSSDSKRSNLKGLALWGAVIGLGGGIIGIIGGGFSIWDRFVPPTVEIIDVRPIYISSREGKFPKRGVGLIVHLRCKNRPVYVNGIDISGKQYLSASEWAGITKNAKNLKEISREFNEKKPYSLVSYTGWMTDSKIPIKLESYEERYIRFTFLEPTSGIIGIPSNEKYIGYDNNMKRPTIYRTHLQAWDFFSGGYSKTVGGWWPTGIRDEIKNGNMKIKIRIASKTIEIPSAKIQNFKLIREKDWYKNSPEFLFHEKRF